MVLDLSAAFDTIDHGILLSHLEHGVGIRGSALSCIKSFISGRIFIWHWILCFITFITLTLGVPQGSSLSPTPFSLYMLPLGSILNRHVKSFNFYADDIKIDLPLKPNDKEGLETLLACLADIRSRISSSLLHLNAIKTVVIVFGHSMGKGKMDQINLKKPAVKKYSGFHP